MAKNTRPMLYDWQAIPRLVPLYLTSRLNTNRAWWLLGEVAGKSLIWNGLGKHPYLDEVEDIESKGDRLSHLARSALVD